MTTKGMEVHEGTIEIMMKQASAAQASSFIDSVISLNARLAVFDCDGTLWSGDAGEGFFDWELKRGVVSDEVVRWARARYVDYRAGKVSEDEMCGEMVTLHQGLKESDVLALGRRHAHFGAARLRGEPESGPGKARARERLDGLLADHQLTLYEG